MNPVLPAYLDGDPDALPNTLDAIHRFFETVDDLKAFLNADDLVNPKFRGYIREYLADLTKVMDDIEAYDEGTLAAAVDAFQEVSSDVA